MVDKFLFFYQKFLNKEVGSLNSAALLLGAFSLLSQLIGLFRDRFLAHLFGAGLELDIYYAAFRIPDLIFVTVGSMVSISVLVPFILDKDKSGRDELRRFIDSIFSFFGILILVVTTLAWVLMPKLSGLLFQGFDPDSLEKVISISRILLISPLVLGLSNLLGSITQAYRRFMVYALAPVLYNLGIILGLILLSEKWGIMGAVWGVALGVVMHLLVQLPAVWKEHLVPRPTLSLDWPQIVQVVKISLPRTLTLSMSAITFIVLTGMAANLSTGSVSVFNFANNLQTISLSLIGVSYSLAAFPTLARRFQEGNWSAFIQEMQISTRFIIFWSLPLTALFIVLRAQVVRVLLGSGLFDWGATRLTAAALALFVFSTLFQSLLLLWMRGFYSAGRTLKPFFINLVSTIILIVGTFGLLSAFNHYGTFSHFVMDLLKLGDIDPREAEMLMLPLGFTLGTIVNGLLMWVAFEFDFRGYSRGVMRALFQGIASAVVIGLVTYLGLELLDDVLNINTFLGILLQGLGAGIMGIVAGVFVLALFKSEELLSVYESFRNKFWKAEAIASDREIV